MATLVPLTQLLIPAPPDDPRPHPSLTPPNPPRPPCRFCPCPSCPLSLSTVPAATRLAPVSVNIPYRPPHPSARRGGARTLVFGRPRRGGILVGGPVLKGIRAPAPQRA
ncbi:unnamed protein product [Pleuronectes platessa]|uniref:Uncharacterized protein n=1 Tax=Pleuronectes platessa TaxID=8262 RepID=A0A9N7ZFU6_PLEPL|nr:unnamed protein product [Pleuronectes platessa]